MWVGVCVLSWHTFKSLSAQAGFQGERIVVVVSSCGVVTQQGAKDVVG